MNDIDAITQLEARYCRFLDVKDWTAWRDLFTDDFVGDTSEAGGQKIEGADAFVAFVHRNLGSLWRIKSSKLTRLREDIVTPLFSIHVSHRLRNLLAMAARSRVG